MAKVSAKGASVETVILMNPGNQKPIIDGLTQRSYKEVVVALRVTLSKVVSLNLQLGRTKSLFGKKKHEEIQ
jgi:hypothetical protein